MFGRKKTIAMKYTHNTTPTRFVEAKGIRFVYRRFTKDDGVLLLLMQHSRGGMDHLGSQSRLCGILVKSAQRLTAERTSQEVP